MYRRLFLARVLTRLKQVRNVVTKMTKLQDLSQFVCLFVFLFFPSGKACVAFHSYSSSVRCMYPLKNNPTLGMGHGPEGNRPDIGLFREHEVRDASVQTDPGVSGAWGYASRGPTLADQIKG